MRRPNRLGLIAVVILVLGIGGYSVFWWVAAGRIESGATAWVQAARQQGIDASWQTLQVAGYPFGFRIETTGFRAVDRASTPALEVAAPRLDANVHTWSLHSAVLTAPEGLNVTGAGVARLSATRAEGTVAAGAAGGGWVWLDLTDAKLDLALPSANAASKHAQLWLLLPAKPAASDTEPNIAVAADFRDISLPVVVPALGGTVADMAFGITIKGPIPPGPAAQAAAAWRDAGGTADLDHLDLAWGPLGANANGTLALDKNLQPIGSFSGRVAGVDSLLKALAAAGQISSGDARLAGLALRLMEKPGPDGKTRLATSLSIQDGQIFLGPARLGRMPRIEW